MFKVHNSWVSSIIGVVPLRFVNLRSLTPSESCTRFVIQNWMRTRPSVEFLGLWEVLNNPDFNRVEFDTVRNESGSNAFVMTPTKWISLTGAIGVISKAGRYGGTFAHRDIAFQLVCLANLENLNALFIKEGLEPAARLTKLNRIAIEQMEILTQEHSRKLLETPDGKE